MEPEPPLLLKETVWVTTGMFSQIAYSVMFPVTAIVASSITVPSALVAQPLNCLPSGAVKPHAGRV